jgi:hypothetical protein
MAKTPYEDRWVNKVERFNVKFPPGTPVVYTAPNGARFNTHIRYPAVVLQDGCPVIWLKNIREYCRFDRVVII